MFILFGTLFVHELFLFSIIAIALMNIFLVIRNTRKDEETGRTELVRSLPVGRLSNLLSTFYVCIIVNAILAVSIGLGLYLLGIESMCLEGSLLYGAALGIMGIFFGSVAAVFAQIASVARGASRILPYVFRNYIYNSCNRRCR